MRELGTISTGLPVADANGVKYSGSANRPFRLLMIGIRVYFFGNPPAFSGDIEYESQFGFGSYPAFPSIKMSVMPLPGQNASNPLEIQSSGFPDKEILYPGSGNITVFVNVGLYSPGNPGNNFFAISPYDPAILQVEWL